MYFTKLHEDRIDISSVFTSATGVRGYLVCGAKKKVDHQFFPRNLHSYGRDVRWGIDFESKELQIKKSYVCFMFFFFICIAVSCFFFDKIFNNCWLRAFE